MRPATRQSLSRCHTTRLAHREPRSREFDESTGPLIRQPQHAPARVLAGRQAISVVRAVEMAVYQFVVLQDRIDDRPELS